MAEDRLLDDLCALGEAQLDVVVHKLGVPPAILPGATAALATRAVALLQWAQQQQGLVDEVRRLLAEVTAPVTPGPLSRRGPPRRAGAVPAGARDVIDFHDERARHERFVGREDVLAAIDACLLGPGAARGWVLVTGQPGMGKSAILTRWLTLSELAGRPAPHHFVRRGVADWDRPEAIARSLAAQIERLYPAQADPEAAPQRRLLELLGRVSREVLAPRGVRIPTRPGQPFQPDPGSRSNGTRATVPVTRAAVPTAPGQPFR
jgi:AAA ATPase domain